MTVPITPSPELVEQWYDAIDNQSTSWKQQLATRAARWGADQELKACVDTLQRHAHWDLAVFELIADRRPKAPSLKKQAIAELEKVDMLWDTGEFSQNTLDSLDTIRRAIEALPE